MRKRDRDALERAIAMAGRLEPGRSEQLNHMLADGRPWREVAEFAAYCAQCITLRLRPWESPPAWVGDLRATLAAGDDGGSEYRAAQLLQRMLAAGISKYEPDPVGALERAKEPSVSLTEQPPAT
jgi:hypothetical protein